MTNPMTDQQFEESVLNAKGLILVDFWADWCGPCHMVAPTIEEISEELKDKVTVYKHDVDQNPITPGKYGVQGIPTILLFKDGEVVEQFIGVQPKQAYVEGINKHA